MTAFNSKLRHNKLLIIVHVLPNTYDFQVLRCCFGEDIREMYKDSKRAFRTTVLLIKPCLVTFSLLSPSWFAKTP